MNTIYKLLLSNDINNKILGLKLLDLNKCLITPEYHLEQIRIEYNNIIIKIKNIPNEDSIRFYFLNLNSHIWTNKYGKYKDIYEKYKKLLCQL